MDASPHGPSIAVTLAPLRGPSARSPAKNHQKTHNFRSGGPISGGSDRRPLSSPFRRHLVRCNRLGHSRATVAGEARHLVVFSPKRRPANAGETAQSARVLPGWYCGSRGSRTPRPIATVQVSLESSRRNCSTDASFAEIARVVPEL